MPGWELINHKEKNEILKIFSKSNGVMFGHAFESRRNNIFRVRDFEKKICDFFNVKYCVATTSGTMAQYVAMKSLGIKKGDEVITQSFTFVATIEAILALGAQPIVINIDKSFNMCPKELEKKISNKTKLIIPVSMLGNPCDMNKIIKISKRSKIPILEDACESLGAKYRDKFIGTIGDVGVFSLDFAKTITTGEGGLILTNNNKLYKFCKEYIDHGHQNNKYYLRSKDKRKIFGLNLRMTELQAAVGLAQLKKLNFILRKNKKNKEYIIKRLIKNNSYELRLIHDENELCDTIIILFKKKKFALNLEKVLLKNNFNTKNLPDALDWHFTGNWEHIFNKDKIYRNNYNYKWNKSRILLERSVAIPIFVNSTKKSLNLIIKIINAYFEKLKN